MNLGLTGPLNPLRPGNAALGAQPPRPPPVVRREAAGSGVFCCGGQASGQGWAPRPARPSPPSPPPPSRLLFLPPPWPGHPPLYFPPSAGRRAQPWSGAKAARAAGAARLGPGGWRRPGASLPEGLRLSRGRAGACAAAAGDLAAALAARSPSASLRRGLGSWPARGAEGSERRSRFGIGGSRGNNSCLSFEEIFLVGKSLFLRVWMQRAVPRVCGRRELRWTPNWSGRVSPHPHGRVLFVSLIFHFPSSNLLDLFNFSFNIN